MEIKIEKIIGLLHRIGKLKDIERTGWVLKKVPNPESVADHSFRTAIMAFLLSDEAGLDKNKCIQMALIHDIGESLVGDITPHDKINEVEKHECEKEAIESLFKGIDDNIINLWDEYEKKETAESKFVYELDKIEMLLQAYEYEKKYEGIDFSEFWKHVEARVENPIIIGILEELKK